MYKVKKCLSVMLIISLFMTTATGCSTILRADATSYPLPPALTQQEVLDYYAKAMDYDTVVSRNIKKDVTQYELHEVTDPTKLLVVKEALNKTEGYLGNDKYIVGSKDRRYLNESLYNYVKATLNDKIIVNTGEEPVIKQALGYYFVDVNYVIGAAPIGTFNKKLSLIGTNGGFVRSDLTGEDSIDAHFLQKAQKELTKYFKENSMNSKATFNAKNGTFSITGDGSSVDSYDYTKTTIIDEDTSGEDLSDTIQSGNDAEISDSDLLLPKTDSKSKDKDNKDSKDTEDEDKNNNDKSDKTGDELVNETSDNAEDENDDTIDSNEVTLDDENDILEIDEQVTEEIDNAIKTVELDPRVKSSYKARNTGLNLQLFNKVAGYGDEKAYIPKLSLIYSAPTGTDGISGIGLYPSGGLGLTLFGYDRKNLSGNCTMRYVYKEDLTDPNKLTCTNIYVYNYEINSGFSVSGDSLIPEFLSKEFNILLDRADRAVTNCDITGLSNGTIFNDVGMAVLEGYTEEYSNVLRQISKICRIVSRDIKRNAYLVEIESFRQEGAESADVYASYKDTVYAVIEQSGSKFIITDWMIMNRQLVTEPDISPDEATAKRIVALGLTGEVGEIEKGYAKKLVSDLYKASTYRLLNGPSTTKDGTTIEKGMYDCFNNNVEMLSSTEKEAINSRIRELLVKYGTGTSAEMLGTITEWIGGASNQIEFTTEELIRYSGKEDGVYLRCYYLISCIEDKWVIDDIQILDKNDISGEELNTIYNRLSSN